MPKVITIVLIRIVQHFFQKLVHAFMHHFCFSVKNIKKDLDTRSEGKVQMTTFIAKCSITLFASSMLFLTYPLQGILMAYDNTPAANTSHALHDKNQVSSSPANEPGTHLFLPTADIIIDAGHGGIDGGTTFGKITENTSIYK